MGRAIPLTLTLSPVGRGDGNWGQRGFCVSAQATSAASPVNAAGRIPIVASPMPNAPHIASAAIEAVRAQLPGRGTASIDAEARVAPTCSALAGIAAVPPKAPNASENRDAPGAVKASPPCTPLNGQTQPL